MTTSSNNNNKSWICSFHITWIAFWFCFFVWFCTSNIYSFLSSETSFKSLSIVDHQIAGGLSITSTVLFRVIIAYFIPKYGSRICYATVLSLTSITLIALCIINNKLGYFICHFCLGITGASFVVTQYHTTQMVSNRVVGFAQAITAGFGNFGGGCANSVMPLLLYHFNISWRVYMIILSVTLILIAIIYYFGTEDEFQHINNNNLDPNSITINPSTNNTNSTDHAILLQHEDSNSVTNSDDRNQNTTSTHITGSFRQTICDYRVWILAICYGICFGVELTFYLQAAYWFRLQFGFDEIISGVLVTIWSSMNLPARPNGGYCSDSYNIQKRVNLLACILSLEGIFTTIFGLSLSYNNYNYSIVFSVCIMLLFSWTVQMAEGIVFSIVPFIAASGDNTFTSKAKGHVMGIVSSGGNLGATIFIFAIFIPFTRKYGDIDGDLEGIDGAIWNPWIILGVIIMICSTTALFIKFTEKEIQKSNRLRENNDTMYV